MEYNNLVINAAAAKRYDPTHTLGLRNMFARDMAKRFNELIAIIKKAIIEQDCFGLKKDKILSQQMQAPGQEAFSFARSVDKVQAFMKWLREQEEKGILQIGELTQIGTGIEGAWTNKYVFDSYKRGVQRARYEMKKAKIKVPSIEETGGLEITMATPFHINRVGLLYSRVYENLKGITAQMDTQISRILAQGIADGDNPILLARKLVSTINGAGMGELGITDSLGRFIPAKRRSEMIARTEVVRAHHQAMMEEYKNWEVEGVTVIVEWVTAGHNVCPECSSLEGQTFTIDQIMNMIPYHPNCRCVAVPVPQSKLNNKK